MDNDRNRPDNTGGYDSPHKDEYDRMVEQIKAKRKAMSKSIWTDEPLLKPYKSIWIDDDEDENAKTQPEPETQPVQPAYEPQTAVREAPQEPPAPEPAPDPFNAHTPEYYEPNPFIRDARDERLAFGVEPEHYDEVIMPFVNEYSVERKLPDQRKNLSRKPKANAAVDLAAGRSRNERSVKAPEKPKEQTQPVVHKLRHERFFDDEGEPLHRHTPEKSSRKRPKMIPLSKRREIRQSFDARSAVPNDIDGDSNQD